MGLPSSNRLPLVPGVSADFEIDLVDPSTGQRISAHRLAGASAKVLVRTDPLSGDVLLFTTDDASHLVIDPFRAVLTVHFLVVDTNMLTVGQPYVWQVELDLADGEIKTPIPWAPVDVTTGGSTAPTPPAVPSTVTINADFRLPNDMQYLTPGGSPIVNAQIRVYLKSDYDAGKLQSPVGYTTTDAYGKWTNPILVTTGFTYIARFEKPYEWGPDTKEFFA